VSNLATLTVNKVATASSGDLNGDGAVNAFDFRVICQTFGSSATTTPKADANQDGAINVFDFLTVSQNYGRSY